MSFLRGRLFALLFFGATLLTIALSTGERLYLLLTLVMGCMVVLSLVSGLWAFFTLTLDTSVAAEALPRQEQQLLTVRSRHRCPLPIAPLRLTLLAPGGEETLRLSLPLFRQRVTRIAMDCPHVGRFEVGIRSAVVEDLFGLFAFSTRRHAHSQSLLVLPRRDVVEPLRFSPGDYESETISRATEDTASPSGVRGYQQGDELKKVHWKLSLRKREILIKTYDQPTRPDALVLLDCTRPPEGQYAEWVQDRLCDLAASLCAALAEADAALRMPLTGDPPQHVVPSGTENLQRAPAALARMNFSGATSLERVLQLEVARMRRSGATVLLASRLSPRSTDLILRLRRLGPTVRVYLVVERLSENDAIFVQRLVQNDVPCVVEQLDAEA